MECYFCSTKKDVRGKIFPWKHIYPSGSVLSKEIFIELCSKCYEPIKGNTLWGCSWDEAVDMLYEIYEERKM